MSSDSAKAYVPGFDYDIFISYAHVDDLEGWVQAFHEGLEIKLAQRFGRIGRVQIWRDKKLSGDALFDDVIKNRINKSALFLALNSHGYNESDYCKQEVDWFHDKASGDEYGVRIGERMRFFNVRLYDIPHTQWPEEFGRTSGFAFYDPDADEPLPAGDKAYQSQLNTLVKAIDNNVKAFHEKASLTQPPSTPAPTTERQPAAESFDIFVAEVADTQRDTRKRLVSDLERQGFTVHERFPPPYPAAEHEQAVTAAMQQSLLSVHLLDDLPGADIDGDDDISYPRKQIELGRQHAGSQLVWVPGHLDLEAIDDQRQKDLLKGLRDQERETAGRFIQVLPNEIPGAIGELLEELKAAQASSTDAKPLAVLLDTHIKDQMLAMEISQYLLRHNILPYINPQEDNPRRNLEALKEQLQRTKALIIFYGQVNEEWVRARLTEAMKIIIEEGYPVKAYGVYLAPPNNGKAALNLGPGIIPLDNRNGFDPASVKPLLDSLGVVATP